MSSDRPVAIVSGAARGIGAASARRLAARGFAVALIDLPTDPARLHTIPGPYRHATGAELDIAAAACGGHGEAHSADVRNGSEVTQVVAAVLERHGRIDAVVAAAGAVAGGAPVWETDDDTWRAMIDINLTGVFNLARAALPAMVGAPEPRNGRFVAIASAAAHHGLPQMAAYSAAKHGVAGLVRALSAELGDTGITANAVAPGSTDTEMLRASAAIYGLGSVDEFVDQARIGRLIEPDEIASTVEWLCVDAPGSLTGAIIDVNGGFRA
jgi:SDR family mycofactocin-dependent oxidoreductase